MRLSDELHAADAPRFLWEVLWESTDPTVRPLVQALHTACGGDYELTTMALDWEAWSSMREAVEFNTLEWRDDTGESYCAVARHEALVRLIVEVHRQLGRSLDLLACDHPKLRVAAIMALGADAGSSNGEASTAGVSLDALDRE